MKLKLIAKRGLKYSKQMKEKLSVELMLVIFDNKIRLVHLFLSFACIVQIMFLFLRQ